jgi:two-component system LytT family response regulator
MNVLIVDDEPLARDWLIRLLERMPDVQVLGEATDGAQAVAQAKRLRPDVVLLDIHIPGLNGLEVARSLEDVPFVFTTAHGRYAVEAFELEACDYLLKPIGHAQLATALARARRRRVLHELLRKDDVAAAALTPEAGTLIVRERGVMRIIDARRVTRFRAQDKYTSFRLDGEEFFVRDALDSLEQRLVPLGFLRVHRAELVRRTAILGMTSEPGGGVALQLADGQVVAVSRRYQAATRRWLGIA